MCSHISILHDFEEEIIFSSCNDGTMSDDDFDDGAVLMEFDLCIPLEQSCFHIMETIFFV